MSLLLLSILTFAFSTICASQNTFEFTIKDTLTDQLINDAVELENGSYLLLGAEVYPTDHMKAHLYRISSAGALLDSLTLTCQGLSSSFIKIIQIEPNLFVLAGFAINSNNKQVLWLYEMDSLFTQIRSVIMPLGLYDLSAVSDLLISNNNILCAGNVVIGLSPYAFIYKISPSFDSLQLRILTEHVTQLPIDILCKNNNTGYYGFLTGFGPPKTEVMVDLDTSFSIKHIIGVSNDDFNGTESRWINQTTIIYCSTHNSAQAPLIRSIGVLCLDTLGNLKRDYYIGEPDTVEWPGLRSRLDFIDTNTIYIGGTHNFYQYSEFGPVNCWFSLNQMDTALNVNWQHFYGGDANYTMYGIRATQDNGCLMFGSRYDFQGSGFERDIYVYKVDQNGLITGTDNKPNPRVHNAIVFPNPGTDFLNVESGLQISGAKIIMMDINGKQVLNKTIQDSHFKIETQSIPSGSYFWQIIYKNQMIENGKWIKCKISNGIK